VIKSSSLKITALVMALSSALILSGWTGKSFAQAVEIPEGSDGEMGTPIDDTSVAPAPRSTKTGKDKAKTYFQRQNAPETIRAGASGAAPRYLAIHLGRMFADQGYSWGKRDQSGIGNLNAGVTYRIGEWVNSMDLNLRIDYTSYSLAEGSARKLSVGTVVTFPDANSQFPLYFGGGIGAGVFIKQLPNESVLAFDYQLLAGARFLNLYNNIGVMAEAGIKNHVFMLSDGQYNGVFFNLGAVFAF
jgi:hypothetical protein